MNVIANNSAEQTVNITVGKVYHVIGLDHDSYRIINDLDEPIIYKKSLFDTIDGAIPSDWVCVKYSDDEYYINPVEFSSPGFYEDLFDGNAEAQEVYKKYRIDHNI